MPTRIIVWQPLLTAHQSATLEALGAAMALPVTVHVTRLEDQVRAGQGWTAPATSTLAVELLPKTGQRRAARRIVAAHPDAIHVFGSPFEVPALMLTLATALLRRRQVFLIAEPYPAGVTSYFDRPSPRDRLKAAARPWLYRVYGGILRGRVAGVFAISAAAVRQFRAMGIAAERVFPFGYFVPSTGAVRPLGSNTGPLRAVFAGAFIARKGLAELAGAAARLRDAGVAIDIDAYGPGDPAPFGLAEAGIACKGRIAFGGTQAVFAGYDLAIVPSRHDGWGVVVNEALLAGVPMLCSDAVGAQAVVRAHGCGVVVAAGDAAALAAALATLADDRGRLEAMAAAARRVAPLLEPAVAGRYMADCIAAALGGTAAPANPWYGMP